MGETAEAKYFEPTHYIGTDNLIKVGSKGIAVRALTFGGRERALFAPYPQMWPLSKGLPRRFLAGLLMTKLCHAEPKHLRHGYTRLIAPQGCAQTSPATEGSVEGVRVLSFRFEQRTTRCGVTRNDSRKKSLR